MSSPGINKTSLFFLLSILIWLSQAWAVDLDKPIKEIRIDGNQRSNINTIRFYIHSKVGETYSVQESRADIRRIYKLGYFDDIQVEILEEAGDLILVYHMKEKPFVQSVKMEGNKVITEKEMLTGLKLKNGTFFQKHLLKKDIKGIKEKYRKKGFYFTEVEPRIKEAGNNQVDVVYHVDEKSKIKITNVEFRGNSYYKDYQLEEIIETDTVGFWSFVSDSGNFQREILKTDLLRLESFYRDGGFIKVRINEPKVEVDKQNGIITVSFDIHEGGQYKVDKITAEGDKVHTAEEILEKVTLKKGDPFNQSMFRSSMFDITEMYSDKGYAFASVIPTVREHPETRTVDLGLRVDYGSKIYIGRIKIVGNDKTQENVIRREFRMHEGEIFSSSKLRRTRQRLANLQFFEQLEIEQKSGREPDLIDPLVTVVEQQTGNVRAGVGYSTVESLLFQAEITETNLFGTGRKLTLGMESSGLRDDYYIDLSDPRFMDHDILLGFRLFTRQSDFISYTSYAKGGGVTVGRAIGEFTSVRLGYTLENVTVRIDDTANATSFLRAQEGERLTSSLSPVITKDTRDNFLNPSSGYRVQLATQFAGGPLGGEMNFYKLKLKASRYYQLPLNFVFMTRLDIKYASAYGGKDLPIFEHYFLGGASTLRGFSFRDVGPVDTNGDAFGGDSSLLFNLEISYSFSKAIRGLMFYDRGQVYGEEGDLSKTTSNRYDFSNMRHSVGFGVRFITPMAPIHLIWGFKLDPIQGESVMEFHFSLGGTF